MALVFRSPAKDGHVRSAGTRKSHLPIAVTLAVCGLLLSSVGCGSTSNAAARLRNAATTLSPRLGQSADDIANRFRSQFRGQSDEAIAAHAELAVAKTTWLDSVIARAAQNRAKIAKVAHRAACDWIEIRDAYVNAPEGLQAAALAEIIVGHIQSQSLEPDEAEILEIVETVLTEVERLENGTLSPTELALDLACLF